MSFKKELHFKQKKWGEIPLPVDMSFIWGSCAVSYCKSCSSHWVVGTILFPASFLPWLPSSRWLNSCNWQWYMWYAPSYTTITSTLLLQKSCRSGMVYAPSDQRRIILKVVEAWTAREDFYMSWGTIVIWPTNLQFTQNWQFAEIISQLWSHFLF